jgi:hypothetical protein
MPTGSLLSGVITCDECGWKSKHYAYANDAIAEWTHHAQTCPQPTNQPTEEKES